MTYIIEHGDTDGYSFDIKKEVVQNEYDEALKCFNSLKLDSYEYKTLVKLLDDEKQTRNLIKYRHWRMKEESDR